MDLLNSLMLSEDSSAEISVHEGHEEKGLEHEEPFWGFARERHQPRLGPLQDVKSSLHTCMTQCCSGASREEKL